MSDTQAWFIAGLFIGLNASNVVWLLLVARARRERGRTLTRNLRNIVAWCETHNEPWVAGHGLDGRPCQPITK